MGFNEVGERNWKDMPPLERMAVLDVLMAGTEWAESTLIVAQIPSFDDLPSEVRGRLILAMTETGFSVEEFNAVRTAYRNARAKWAETESAANPS